MPINALIYGFLIEHELKWARKKEECFRRVDIVQARKKFPGCISSAGSVAELNVPGRSGRMRTAA